MTTRQPALPCHAVSPSDAFRRSHQLTQHLSHYDVACERLHHLVDAYAHRFPQVVLPQALAQMLLADLLDNNNASDRHIPLLHVGQRPHPFIRMIWPQCELSFLGDGTVVTFYHEGLHRQAWDDELSKRVIDTVRARE